jgi:predicted RNase H-like nuclease (RuvC/YqgF family)
MFVGMTPAEITEFKRGLAIKARVEATSRGNKTAASPSKDGAKPSFASHVPDRSVPCQRPDCIQERQEVVKLLGILNEQQTERQNLQIEIQELINRVKEIKARRAEVQQDEKEHQEALELRDKLIAELEKYVARLQEENSKLKGGYKPPTVEDYVSEEDRPADEERSAKRARVD